MNKVKQFKRLKRKVRETDRLMQQAEYFSKQKRKKLERKLHNLNSESRMLREGQDDQRLW